jgi:hypothetical protein
MEEGWGWWCGQGDEAKGFVGLRRPLTLSPRRSGHTTTQPSSVEEEGLRN